MLYAFGTLSTTGTITLSVDDERYIRQLSAKGIKMILSVGGWGYANLFPPIARDPVAQKRFSDSLAALSSQHGFVGIDIDWEYPAGYKDAAGNIIPGSEGDNLANWLIQLRAAVGPNYLIMMAVPPLPFHLNNYPMTVMATVLDYLLVMTYDFSGPWTTTIGSNTPNNQIFPALDDIVAKGFAREKVVLGLANFGKTYRLSDPVNCRTFGCSFTTTALPKGACSDTEGILFNNEVEWYLPTASVSTDSTTGSSFFITTGNHNTGFPLLDAGINQFVNFETQNDMRVKDDLARTRCLGGTMVWTMDQDTTGSWVVW
ncbi:glycoside hydrolase superfamily [Chytridium lagenaria]|nr:glycoside hydrolase superfamily [Chytridium lagenaria]